MSYSQVYNVLQFKCIRFFLHAIENIHNERRELHSTIRYCNYRCKYLHAWVLNKMCLTITLLNKLSSAWIIVCLNYRLLELSSAWIIVCLNCRLLELSSAWIVVCFTLNLYHLTYNLEDILAEWQTARNLTRRRGIFWYMRDMIAFKLYLLSDTSAWVFGLHGRMFFQVTCNVFVIYITTWVTSSFIPLILNVSGGYLFKSLYFFYNSDVTMI